MSTNAPAGWGPSDPHAQPHPSTFLNAPTPDMYASKDSSSDIPPPLSAVHEEGELRDVERQAVVRTPSPTPSETGMLEGSIWNPTGKKKTEWRECMSKDSLVSFAILGISIALVVVFLVFQQKIIDGLKPFGDWLHRTPGAWLIPIAILFVLSFPPLFGSGIFAILCGTVWGVWIGFGIVTAGTILGELANFYLFKWCCVKYGKTWEDKYLMYALWSEVVREGGFIVPTIMRYTSYPGHFLTAIFATCGMGGGEFLIGALLSSPKQLATVYLGVAQSNTSALAGAKAGIIVGLTTITYIALWYIGRKIEQVKVKVIYERRKRRQAKMLRAGASLELPEHPTPSSATRVLAQP
ncbi:uncharacterized protein TRAVEDRAFT_150723 [Trametes versicolor FP-101664 SS1]|uniref:uncharacterized protein n=1 Tax=Trametes versicolor (strain FP-101664) TaxID=717944 RepID=UPI0004623DB9|nr:uncharacterized protein TRAVEDRAFT_150723 [Trametes versicolor FP-101664 SS1]EIW58060.1 hypothetical protein TRAVEDRAFT_150723 [Trametes versicolor FP-101664 SS1]